MTDKTCTTCRLYLTCKDVKKSFNFYCDKYKQTKITIGAIKDPLTTLLESGLKKEDPSVKLDSGYFSNSDQESTDDIEGILARSTKSDEENSFLAKKAEFDISKVMTEATETSGLVPHDLKVSDQDMKEYPNFYSFATDDGGLKIKPYLMQIIAATITFAEYCPIDSNLDWLFHDRKVDDNYIVLEKNVCFLENGVCPVCGRTRSSLVAEGLVNHYNEMAIVAGQRCVKGNTRVLSMYGLTTIDELYDLDTLEQDEFTDCDLNLRSKFKVNTAEKIYKSSKSDIYRVTLSDGTYLEGTLDHPIEVYLAPKNGTTLESYQFVIIDDLKEGMLVPTYIGTMCFAGLSFKKITKGMLSSHRLGIAYSVRSSDYILQISFLASLLSSEGILDKDLNILTIQVEHELYALDLVLLFRNLGIYAYIKKTTSRIIDLYSVCIESSYFSYIRFHFDDTLKNNILYLNILCCSSGEIHKGITESVVMASVVSVEKVDFDYTYDFTVSSEHNFISNGMLSHNCVMGSTPILTEDGLMEIAEYAKGKPLGFSDFNLGIYNGEYVEKTSDFYISEKKEYVKRVTTETGHSITCTDDHPLLVINQENLEGVMVPTKDLKVGDYLKLRYDTQVFGNKLTYINDIVDDTETELKNRFAQQQVNTAWKFDPSKQDLDFLPESKRPKTLTTDLCEVMGLWVAEGRRRGFSNKDPEILDYFKRKLSTLIEPHTIYNEYRDGERCGILLKGAKASIFLEKFLGQGLLTGSGDKRIPLSIRQGTKKYQSAFLRGLFEGDGGVEISSTKNITLSYHGIISHCTICRRLHMQVSAMLMNLGIVHRLRYKKAWASNGSAKQVAKIAYIIEIQDKRFINKYATDIGFISSTKTARLQELIDIYDNRRNTKASVFDKLPICVGSTLADIVRSKTCSGNNIKLFGPQVAKIINRLRGKNPCLTFDNARLTVDALSQNKSIIPSSSLSTLGILAELASNGVAYTRIKSIKKSKRKIRTYDFTLPKTHKFIGSAIVQNQSGKSALVAMMSAYLTHKIIKLQNPTVVYDLLPNSILHGTFVALTYAQAKDTLWEPYYKYLLTSPWFNQYHELLNFYANKYGEEFYKLRDTFVYYKNRAFLCYASAPHSKVLRGRTRILSSLDEIGLFDHTAEQQRVRTNATEIHISLERSLLTIRSAASRLVRQGFNNVPTGYFFNVSSPFSQYDKIMQLYKSSLTSKKIFGMKLATWEMNPTITMDDLEEEFSKDPVTAWRDYGSIPPVSSQAMIQAHGTVENAFSQKNNGIRLLYANGKRKDGSSYRYADVSWVRKTLYPSVLALDAGFCVSGSNYIPTELGLIKLEDLLGVNPTNNHLIPLDLKVGSLNGASIAKYWIYSGIKPTYKVTTLSGHCISATIDHKVAVLRSGRLVWVKIKDLNMGDLMCIPSTPITRSIPLELNLTMPEPWLNDRAVEVPGVYRRKKNKIPTGSWLVIVRRDGKKHHLGTFYSFDLAAEAREKAISSGIYESLAESSASIPSVQVPTIMTTDLAFLIGALISEGWYGKQTDSTGKQPSYTGAITNSNKKYLRRLQICLFNVFGVKGRFILKSRSGSTDYIHGRKIYRTKNVYDLRFSSKAIYCMLNELGVKSSDEHGIKSSYYKEVPWCILQADTDSQLAFLAAYIEGDGSINEVHKHIAVSSKSDILLEQMQFLLGTHGVHTYKKDIFVTTSSIKDAISLYRKIRPFLSFMLKDEFIAKGFGTTISYGFPSKHWIDLIEKLVPKGHRNNARQICTDTFLYANYDAGKYDSVLNDLSKLAPYDYQKLVQLFKLRYNYSPVTSISYNGEEKTYDLSMENPRCPAFIANGLLVHNSKNAFAMVAAHKEGDEIVVDIAAEVLPLPGCPLNHTRIFENLIAPIIEAQNVVYVTADRWNSLKLLSDVEQEYGILTKQYSLKYRDFFVIKTLLEQSLLSIPKPSMTFSDIINVGPTDYPGKFLTRPADHLVLQMVTVRDTGNNVVKGDGDLNDDIFRSLALAVYVLTNQDNNELFSRKSESSEDANRSIGTMRMGKMIKQPNLADKAYYGLRARNLSISVGSSASRK